MQKRYLLPFACCSLVMICLFTACQKKEWDAYYGRPSWLAPPIYQQLQAMGNFKHLLAAIDKSGYKATLSSGGYWTLFAPDDSAFEAFYQQMGIKGDDQLDSITASKIVRYALVYNAYREDQLIDYQKPGGADTSMAFKRQTAYYDWVYKENGKVVVAANRNGSYAANDNNYKYIPYFITGFLAANGLSALDYNFFYQNTPFTGFNVADANVIKANIPAENGIIHVINKVILPLPNLEQYLSTNPQYSEFKSLLDRLVRYQSNGSLTQRYQALTGSTDSVYVKLYDASLAFSPNNENYMLSGTDAQTNGWTLVVPTNDVLKAYEQKILRYYKTFDAAPPSVLLTLLNAHMWQQCLWPSKLKNTVNSESEPPTFTLANVIDRKVCSNGFFYGINTVQDANEFRCIYAAAFLNPVYSLMTRALDQDGIKFSIINPSVHYTMFMISDQAFRNNGYDYNENMSSWAYQAPGASVQYGSGPQSRVFRILETSVFITNNGELNDLSGEGIVEAWNGEYIRYKNNTIWASGNADDGTVIHIDSAETYYNGKVYYTDGMLKFTEHTVGYHIQQLANTDPNDFGYFYQYLSNSVIWQPSTQTILGMTPGTFYTVFIPTNQAISNAVKKGLLPGNTSTGMPNFRPSNPDDQQKVINFIYYHILNKNTVVPDGKKSGSFQTLYQTIDGNPTFITINNQLNNMQLIDQVGNTANVNVNISNNLSDRTVIHSIDKVLQYQ